MTYFTASQQLLTRNLSAPGPLWVIIPGWAGLGRHILDLCPYTGPIVTISYTHPETMKQLTDFLNTHPYDQLIILGFSYGGFISLPLLSPFKKKITQYFLVGMCQKYPKKTLQFIHSKLETDHKNYITQFYKTALTKSDFTQFKSHYINDIHTVFSKNILVTTLTHLGSLSITSALLQKYQNHPNYPITLIHGDNDMIAPVADVKSMANSISCPLHLIPNTNHFPFYKSLFWEIPPKTSTMSPIV